MTEDTDHWPLPTRRGHTIYEPRIVDHIEKLSANWVRIVTPHGERVKCHRSQVEATLRWIARDGNPNDTTRLFGWHVTESECESLLWAMNNERDRRRAQRADMDRAYDETNPAGW